MIRLKFNYFENSHSTWCELGCFLVTLIDLSWTICGPKCCFYGSETCYTNLFFRNSSSSLDCIDFSGSNLVLCFWQCCPNIGFLVRSPLPVLLPLCLLSNDRWPTCIIISNFDNSNQFKLSIMHKNGWTFPSIFTI